MFCYNALLKLFRSHWILGIAMKVYIYINILFSTFQWWNFLIYWNDLNFFCLSLSLIHSFFLTLCSCSINSYIFPLVLIRFASTTFLRCCFNSFVITSTQRNKRILPQTPSCTMVKSMLLPSQWLIHLHGKWIWQLKISIKMTFRHLYAHRKML